MNATGISAHIGSVNLTSSSPSEINIPTNQSEYNTTASSITTEETDNTDEIIQTVVYILIGIIGAVGNSFVILVMVSSKHIKSKLYNVLIIHQSIIDCVTSVLLIVTSTNTYDFTEVHYGVFGEFYCRIWALKVPLWSAFMVSTYNLLVLSVERYTEIAHPIYHKISFGKKQLYCAMLAAWLIGFGYNFLLTGLSSGTDSEGHCELMSNWPNKYSQQIVAVLTFVLEYFLPLLVMFLIYSKIAWILKQKSKVGPSSSGHDDNNITQAPNTARGTVMSRARKNVIKTLYIVCICFVLCWTWNQVFFLLYNCGYDIGYGESFYHFTVYAAFVSCCINPFIYIAHFTSFRNAVRSFFKSNDTIPTGSSTIHVQVAPA